VSAKDFRQRIIETSALVLRQLHWQTWSEVHPGAAELAIPKINAIRYSTTPRDT
jgi:hypothetical protein